MNPKIKLVTIDERAVTALDTKFFDGNHMLYGSYCGDLELRPPKETQGVLRMLVRYRDGDLLLPQEYEWVRPMITACDTIVKNTFRAYPFTYLTIRNNFETDHTDEAIHVDGFSMRVAHLPEQNFLWSDTGGTELYKGRVLVAPNFNPMRNNINTSVRLLDDEWQVAEKNQVWQFDPYVFHRAPANKSNRSFVRISYTPIEIDDINNTQNPLLPRQYLYEGLRFRNELTSAIEELKELRDAYETFTSA